MWSGCNAGYSSSCSIGTGAPNMGIHVLLNFSLSFRIVHNQDPATAVRMPRFIMPTYGMLRIILVGAPMLGYTWGDQGSKF